MEQKAILIIMAKQPVYGTVKTRLCPPLTPDGALALYEAFLLDTIALVDEACKLAGDVTPSLAYSPSSAHDYFREKLPAHFVLLPQTGADLGERLSNLPAQARALGYGPAAMISSDSPTLPPPLVARCFTDLARPGIDAVLGPCTDGGYYLIGMHDPQPALFRGITWSTEHVTRETMAAAGVAGLQVSLLPTWYDADTVEDLRRVQADLEAGTSVAPHTREALGKTISYVLST